MNNQYDNNQQHRRRRYNTTAAVSYNPPSMAVDPASAAIQQQQYNTYNRRPSAHGFNNSSMAEFNHPFITSHGESDRRQVMPFNSTAMPFSPFGSFEDPLGPSLFGNTASLLPPSFMDIARPRHPQLADFGLGDLNSSLMVQNQRSIDNVMSNMMMMPMSTGGCYSSQVMVMSSTVGPDGRQHVEKYAKSSAGNAQHKIRETKEAYTNSTSGVDKIAWERQLDTKARRVVKERNRGGEIVSNDEIAGMSRDDECERFNEDWTRVADAHMDVRANLNHPAMLAAGPGQMSQMSQGGQMSQQLITGNGGGQRQQQYRQLQQADNVRTTEQHQQQRRRSQQRGASSRYYDS